MLQPVTETHTTLYGSWPALNPQTNTPCTAPISPQSNQEAATYRDGSLPTAQTYLLTARPAA